MNQKVNWTTFMKIILVKRTYSLQLLKIWEQPTYSLSLIPRAVPESKETLRLLSHV